MHDVSFSVTHWICQLNRQLKPFLLLVIFKNINDQFNNFLGVKLIWYQISVDIMYVSGTIICIKI